MDEDNVLDEVQNKGLEAQNVAKGELSDFLNPNTNGPVQTEAKKPPVFSPYTSQANWKMGNNISSARTFPIPDKNQDLSEALVKSVQPNIPTPEVDMKRPIIRTYKSDMENTIQTNHLSSINIALAENKKMMQRIEDDKTEEKVQRRNYTFLIISVVLILLGIMAIAIPYFIINKKYNTEIIEETVVSTPAIVADSEEILDLGELDMSRIARTLSERAGQVSIKLGTIRAFYLSEGTGESKQLINSSRFLNLIKAKVPTQLSRTIKPTYMFGIHNFNGIQRFLILKVGSFDIAYSGMLEWETELWKDLGVLFDLPDDGNASAFEDTVKDFQDIVIKNKDTRSVKIGNEIVFLYSIPEQDTIILTTSQDTFREILSRMNRTVISQ